MHAVRGIDLQTLATLWGVDDLVDASGAEPLARIAEFLRAALDANVRIEHLQVSRLILVVRSRREEYGRKPVTRRQRAIHPFAIYFRVIGQKLQARVVGRSALQGPRRTTAGDHFERRVGHAEPESLFEPGFEVTNRLELLAARRGPPACVEAVGRAYLHEVFRGQHARTDRLVNAFDLRDVDPTSRNPR